MEIWEKCPELNHRYEVSSHGRIRVRLKPKINDNGYEFVYVLLNDGRWRKRYVHRLVARTFIGPYPPDQEVHHKDFVKLNNRKGNLEYLTYKEHKRKSIEIFQRQRGKTQ